MATSRKSEHHRQVDIRRESPYKNVLVRVFSFQYTADLLEVSNDLNNENSWWINLDYPNEKSEWNEFFQRCQSIEL